MSLDLMLMNSNSTIKTTFTYLLDVRHVGREEKYMIKIILLNIYQQVVKKLVMGCIHFCIVPVAINDNSIIIY